MKFPQLALLFVLMLFLQALPAEANTMDFSQNTKSDWLFLVYMDADNSLGSAAEQDLSEMITVGSDALINIVVLLDKNGVGDSRIYNVRKNMLEPVDDGGIVIPASKEVNMGSAETLRNFLNFSARYQRNHTFLVLWDHGSGWRGFCTDSQSKDSLNLSEIREALSGFEIDVLGIDACEGALMEVVYALRNSAHYFVGSQKDEPENGWNYTMLLNMAHTHHALTPEQFATTAVEAFEKHYNSYSLLSVSVALSAINLSKVEDLAKTVDAFSKDLMTSISLLHFEISSARNSTETYEGDNKADVDLGDFARKSMNTSYLDARKRAGELLEVLGSAVVRSCGISAFFPATNTRADNATGLSIYFPTANFNSEYLKTEFAKATNWSKFLNTFLNPPYVQQHPLNLTISIENNTIKVEAENLHPVIYICDSTGAVVKTSNAESINYTVPVDDYYQIFAYNYTLQNGDLYLDGLFKSEKKWIGENKPNARIKNVEFLREDGVKIFGDSGKHAVENRTFSAKVEVENTGNVNLSLEGVFIFGDVHFRKSFKIEVNNTTTIVFNLSLSAGNYKFNFYLDPDNIVRETNEEDNSYVMQAVVKTCTPSKGITLVLKSTDLCEYRVYNESGALLAQGKVIDKVTEYISPSEFKEGEHLYIHIYSESQSLFKKIQVFSEDDSYEITIGLHGNAMGVIDYVFIGAVVALCSLFAIIIAFWLIKR